MKGQILDFSEANCKNCYRCVRSCKVKAIKVLNNQAKIEEKLCIACGECFLVCSQNARTIHSDIKNFKRFVESKEKVIVSIAPSYKGYDYNGIDMISLLKEIGVERIEETARGADIVSKAYGNYIDSCEKNIHLTSACPSTNLLIEKYFPQYMDLLLPVTTPLLLHGQMLKKQYPNCKVIFVGPCFAKKTEILSNGSEGLIDGVITFDELIDEFSHVHISKKHKVDQKGSIIGRTFAKSGGITKYINQNEYRKIKVEGVEEAIKFLKIVDKLDEKLIVEINSCKGGCLNGPGGEKCSSSYYERLIRIDSLLEEKIEDQENFNFDLKRSFYNKQTNLLVPNEEEIKKILIKMEKYTKEHELNCAACGYNTCREKAVAVFNGMSTIDMCIPFMRNRAERISNEIFSNSPNGIFILDQNLNISEINKAAMEKFYLDKKSIGKNIREYIDDIDFELVLKNEENIIKKKSTYKNYGLICLKSIIYLKDQKALLVIITNITKEEKQEEELRSVKQNTIELTQGVIEKQMRVAQEIASLLGETTAETKVALTKLKNLVEGEF